MVDMTAVNGSPAVVVAPFFSNPKSDNPIRGKKT
jgi:hypothetical protein